MSGPRHSSPRTPKSVDTSASAGEDAARYGETRRSSPACSERRRESTKKGEGHEKEWNGDAPVGAPRVNGSRRKPRR
jgi:hypothetical protein